MALNSFLQRNLATQFVGRRVLYYPSLPTTMTVAREEAKKGTPEGTVVIAKRQTAGKGRLGRSWLSPRGSIALSIVLYPLLNHLPYLIMVASLAVVHTIKEATGLESKIKWPNDVLINGKKVCGILIESELSSNKVNFTIIGIGINVNFSPLDFPEISTLATSLSQELGKRAPHFKLVTELLNKFEQLYLTIKAGGSLHKEWQEHMETLGKFVRVQTNESIEEGYAETITPNGSLLLRRYNGTTQIIVAGDVTLKVD